MTSYSTVLDQTTWGVHLNFEGHFAAPPSLPAWLNALQRRDWQRRSVVVWNAEIRVVTHLYVGYALRFLNASKTIMTGSQMVLSSALQRFNLFPTDVKLSIMKRLKEL